MEIKDLIREKILVEIIAERDDIILQQQKIIEELKATQDAAMREQKNP